MTNTMTTLLTTLREVVTSVVGMLGDIVNAIVAQPLLLVPVGIGFLGAGVAFFKRVKRG